MGRSFGAMWWLLTGLSCGRIGYDNHPHEIEDSGALQVDDASVIVTDDGGTLGSEINIAFITAGVYSAFDFGTMQEADALCSELANDVGHPGSYVAWLSDTESDAVDRLGPARGWARPDGLVIGFQVDDFFSQALTHALILDESGQRSTATEVVTATGLDGRLHSLFSGGPCLNESSIVAIGNPRYINRHFSWHTTGPCLPSPLYCFGKSNYVEPVLTAPTRVAFMTASNWRSGGGLSDADLLCNTEASTAGLAGTFRALLATDAASMASRFTAGAGTWYRPDGARLAATFDAFMRGELDSIPFMHADGTQYIDPLYPWSGIDAGDGTSLGTQTCSDWTTQAGGQSGGLGYNQLVTAELFGRTDIACDGQHPLFCLQE